MINIKVDMKASDILEVRKYFDRYKKVISSKELNVERAKRFKQFTKKAVQKGEIRLVPLSSATIYLTGVHNPEFVNGALMDAMKAEAGPNNSGIAGYWDPSGKVPGKKITYAKLAILQHTGYRIPLTGEKGKRVRAWMAMQGLGTPNAGRNKRTAKSVVGASKWLLVPPRPFVPRALRSYLETNGDSKVIHDYLKRNL